MNRLWLQPQYPVSGPPLECAIEGRDGRLIANLDGAALELEVTWTGEGEGWCSAGDGRIYPFVAVIVNSEVHLWLDGEVYVYRQPQSRRSRTASQATPGGNLLSPMPGKVLQIPVRVGDVVEPGEPVIILESMKTELILRASTAGTVREILVEQDSQVQPGDLLLIVAGEPPAA